MPLRHERDRREETRLGLVRVLEWFAAPGAVMDALATPRQGSGQTVPVQPAHPAQMAKTVVFLRPLALQQRFGLAVATLLPPVGADRIAPVVPDHGGGTKAKRPATLLKVPADIDIVACYTEL